jgi:hypothetical protein
VMALHELPPLIQELDQLLLDVEAWEDLPADAPEADRLADREAFAALNRRIDEIMATLSEEQLEEVGERYHSWLIRLRQEHELAQRELERVRTIVKVRANKLERVKDYVKSQLEAAQFDRLQGSTWRLRIQKNGGRRPACWTKDEPIPAILAKDVMVAPSALVGVVRALARYVPTEHLVALGWGPADALTEAEILQGFGVEKPLELSAERVYKVIKICDGEVPDGIVLEDPGTHLRVE